MPLAAGFVGILPALGLLDEERDGVPPVHLSWIAAVGWSCAVAFFGYDFKTREVLSSLNVTCTGSSFHHLSASKWYAPTFFVLPVHPLSLSLRS